MELEVVSKNGLKMTVYNYGSQIKFCPSEKYNPRLLNARDPTFDGSMDECADYIRSH